MDFTREPIIETVITPKEGCKLVVRSSKNQGQEEFFVDAVEVISFGHSVFFRSTEKPKAFLVPVSDYEVLEVREARMVLKNVGVDRSTIKIGGGKEAPMRTPREAPVAEKQEHVAEEVPAPAEAEIETANAAEKQPDSRLEKKRDRRRNYRRRKGRDGGSEEEGQEGDKSSGKEEGNEGKTNEDGSPLTQQVVTTSVLTSLLPPPPTLISETIARYKDNILFKDAFYTKEEPVVAPVELSSSSEEKSVDTDQVAPELATSYPNFESTEKHEEEIIQQRKDLVESLSSHDSHDSHHSHDYHTSPDEHYEESKENKPHLNHQQDLFSVEEELGNAEEKKENDNETTEHKDS